MIHLKKLVPALAIGAMALTDISGCGGSQPVTYTPAAYGEVTGGVGHCYYVSSADEATGLIASHLCPVGWLATPMPLAWHERYYAYYDSPAYYNRYVPVRARTVYIQHESTFGRTYAVQIRTSARTATWKNSSGRTVTGVKTGKVKFGSGTSFGSSGQRYGGGSMRGGTATRPPVGPARVRATSGARPGTGTVKSGGSMRSGRAR